MTKRRLIFKVFIVFICLVCCELFLRGYIIFKNKSPDAFYKQFCEIHDFNVDSQLGFELKTKQKSKFSKRFNTTFSTNSHGFRGECEYVVPKGKEMRLAIVGASSAFGYGSTSDDTTISSYLQQYFDKNQPHRVEVINAGHPGYTSFQTVKRFQKRLLQLDLDYAILYVGWNDIFIHSRHHDVDPSRHYYRELKKFNWQDYIEYCNRHYHSKIIRKFALSYFFRRFADQFDLDWVNRESITEPIKIIPSQQAAIINQYRQNIIQFIEISRQYGIKPIIVTLFSQYISDNDVDEDLKVYHGLFKAFNQVLLDCAKRYAVEMVEVNLLNIGQQVQVSNPSDKYHLTDEGNELLAEKLYKVMAPKLD